MEDGSSKVLLSLFRNKLMFEYKLCSLQSIQRFRAACRSFETYKTSCEFYGYPNFLISIIFFLLLLQAMLTTLF